MKIPLNINTRSFVKTNKDMFEQVASNYENTTEIHRVPYSMLDYEKILTDICDFIEGYVEYKEKGDETYAGRVIGMTINFYDKMFTDPKYRRTAVLNQIRYINKQFLEKTNRLQDILEKYGDIEDDKDLDKLLRLSNNQYAKLSKVYKDDMQIYLWLMSNNSKMFRTNIPPDLHRAFDDPSTPVLHTQDSYDKYIEGVG